MIVFETDQGKQNGQIALNSILLEKFNHSLLLHVIAQCKYIFKTTMIQQTPNLHNQLPTYNFLQCYIMHHFRGMMPLGHSIRKKAFVPCHTPTPRYVRRLINTNHQSLLYSQEKSISSKPFYRKTINHIHKYSFLLNKDQNRETAEQMPKLSGILPPPFYLLIKAL